MIKNIGLWQAWENNFIRNDKAGYRHNARIMQSMYEEACLMGAFAPTDPLEGLDVKIKTAKILNV